MPIGRADCVKLGAVSADCVPVAVAIDVVAGGLFAILVVVVPYRGRVRYETFRRAVVSDPSARLQYYRSTLPWKSFLAFVAVALYVADHEHGYGVRLFVSGASQAQVVVPLLVGVVLGALIVRRRLSQPSRRAKLARSLREIADLLPRTPAERRGWMTFSISAGITEEVLYRAFVMSVLANLLPAAPAAPIVLISAAVFGLAHLYEGWKGVFLTAVLGVVFSTVVLSAGLVAAMALHALIDLRLLVVPADLVAEAAELRHEGDCAPAP